MQSSLLGELITGQVLSRKMLIPAYQIIIKTSDKGKPFLSEDSK